MEISKKKLHLGCGNTRLEGYVNVDLDATHNPDVVLNLDDDWVMFEDNSIDEIKCHFVLEHIEWRHFFEECYRVLKPDGILDVSEPNCLDFTSWQDPTHVRGYFVNTMRFHICNYEHKHYNTNGNNWNFEHIETIMMFRKNPLNRLFYNFWRLIGMNNNAYQYVWASRTFMRKK